MAGDSDTARGEKGTGEKRDREEEERVWPRAAPGALNVNLGNQIKAVFLAEESPRRRLGTRETDPKEGREEERRKGRFRRAASKTISSAYAQKAHMSRTCRRGAKL